MGQYSILIKRCLFLLAGFWLAGRADPACGEAGMREISPDLLPMIITQSGSYRVTAPLSYAGTSNGITIMAHGVTVDLNGFTLTGPGAAGQHGVYQSPSYRDAVVRNGFVRNWGQSLAFGVYLAGPNSRIERVQVAGCGEGFLVGKGGCVQDCLASQLDTSGVGYGIYAGADARVSGCIVRDQVAGSVAVGISLGEGAMAKHCVVYDVSSSQTAYGLLGDGRNTVEYCAVTDVLGVMAASGIQVTGDGHLRYCAVQSITVSSAGGGVYGLYGGRGSRVERCAVYGCGGASSNGAAIYLQQFGVAVENAVRRNRCAGISLYRDSVARQNLTTLNGNGSDLIAGIITEGERNRVQENHSALNHYGVRATSTNSLFLRNSYYANTQAGSVIANNHLPDSLIRPGLDFMAASEPFNFQDVIW